MSSFQKIARRNRRIALFPWWSDFRENLKVWREIPRWRREGWKPPLPPVIKRAIIKAEATAFGATTLVETGTYLGDTLWFFRDDFKELYSIEVQPELARLARERFQDHPHVEIIEGDSATQLAGVVASIPGRSVYWLDGHYSAGITGRGAQDCPIWGELSAITTHMKAPILILVDDARCFGTEPNYPTIQAVAHFVGEKLPNYSLNVSNDIIRIAPLN